MTEKQFNESSSLKERIFQLNLLKKYLEVFLAKKPFDVNVECSVLGQTWRNIMPYVNGSNETNRNYVEQEDGKAIIEFLTNRIDELQKQFEAL